MAKIVASVNVSHVPDDGQLTDMIPKFAPSAAQQKALLIDNPMRLYWAK